MKAPIRIVTLIALAASSASAVPRPSMPSKAQYGDQYLACTDC